MGELPVGGDEGFGGFLPGEFLLDEGAGVFRHGGKGGRREVGELSDGGGESGGVRSGDDAGVVFFGEAGGVGVGGEQAGGAGGQGFEDGERDARFPAGGVDEEAGGAHEVVFAGAGDGAAEGDGVGEAEVFGLCLEAGERALPVGAGEGEVEIFPVRGRLGEGFEQEVEPFLPGVEAAEVEDDFFSGEVWEFFQGEMRVERLRQVPEVEAIDGGDDGAVDAIGADVVGVGDGVDEGGAVEEGALEEEFVGELEERFAAEEAGGEVAVGGDGVGHAQGAGQAGSGQVGDLVGGVEVDEVRPPADHGVAQGGGHCKGIRGRGKIHYLHAGDFLHGFVAQAEDGEGFAGFGLGPGEEVNGLVHPVRAFQAASAAEEVEDSHGWGAAPAQV